MEALWRRLSWEQTKVEEVVNKGLQLTVPLIVMNQMVMGSIIAYATK